MIFKFIIDHENSAHVHFRMFAGKQIGSLGCAGNNLCLRQEEFKSLIALLEKGGTIIEQFTYRIPDVIDRQEEIEL